MKDHHEIFMKFSKDLYKILTKLTKMVKSLRKNLKTGSCHVEGKGLKHQGLYIDLPRQSFRGLTVQREGSLWSRQQLKGSVWTEAGKGFSKSLVQ